MTSHLVHSQPENDPDVWPVETVEIVTGARLHFGLLTHRPESGREFGGLGVMINSPGWTIRVARLASAGDDEFELTSTAIAACPDLAVKCRTVLNRWRSTTDELRGNELRGVAYRIGIRSAIPSHRGLGSGTQLALALARAVELLESDSGAAHENATTSEMPPKRNGTPVESGEPSHGMAVLARRSGRGLRSAVGTWGFEQGGFIVDGGKRVRDEVGTLIARIAFPANWRFVLIAPESGAGISGEAEVAAFRDLPGMSTASTRQLTAIAMMRLLPAIRDADFDECSTAMTEYGRISGEYFATAQGGVYARPEMAGIAAELKGIGLTGFAQTSWGPTCAVLCRSLNEATAVANRLKETTGSGFDIRVVSPMNHGAVMRRPLRNRAERTSPELS